MSGSQRQAQSPLSIDFDPSIDYYEVLGVPTTASTEEIRRAYHRIARENHPDSTGGDRTRESRFRSASDAHGVLGDESRRVTYDRVRARVRSSSSGMNFELGDLIGQFFSGGSSLFESADLPGRSGPRRGRRRRATGSEGQPDRRMASDGTWMSVSAGDSTSEVRVSFDLAILGTAVTVTTAYGAVQLRIPPGTSGGRRLRLRGRGPADSSGGHGDHYVVVHVDVPGERDDVRGILTRLLERLPSSR